VFTNLSRGVKPVNVDLIATTRMLSFYFMARVANLDVEYSNVDVEKLYSADQIRDVNETELRDLYSWLASVYPPESEDPWQASKVFLTLGRNRSLNQ